LQDEIAVRTARNPGGTGNHIQRIAVTGFSQMVNQNDGEAMIVCKLLECADVIIIGGVGIDALFGTFIVEKIVVLLYRELKEFYFT